jgi:protoheme ferro-lyase
MTWGSTAEVPPPPSSRFHWSLLNEALESIRQEQKGKIDDVLLVPIYPHYAMSSYELVDEAQSLIILAKSSHCGIIPL